jgi:hypothetical protein
MYLEIKFLIPQIEIILIKIEFDLFGKCPESQDCHFYEDRIITVVSFPEYK